MLRPEHFSAYYCRYVGGKKIRGNDVNGLEELMTICAMCNDSSVDFNEVSKRPGYCFTKGHT